MSDITYDCTLCEFTSKDLIDATLHIHTHIHALKMARIFKHIPADLPEMIIDMITFAVQSAGHTYDVEYINSITALDRSDLQTCDDAIADLNKKYDDNMESTMSACEERIRITQS